MVVDGCLAKINATCHRETRKGRKRSEQLIQMTGIRAKTARHYLIDSSLQSGNQL